MQVNLEQHEAFHNGFEAMETYFTKVQKDPSVHDGQKIRNMIEEFGAVFQKHLEDEIATLEKSKLQTIFPDEADMKKVSDDLTQYAIKHGSKLTSFPWVLVWNRALG
jgi:light-regulated signal transduction histidine kinase (bacteriophytochrome)